MAFGFFRRRQKMVIIIMVVLMVSFLVGLQGLNMLIEKDWRKRTFAETRLGTLTHGEVSAAQAELDLLSQIGMGQFHYPPWPTEREYDVLVRLNGYNARVAYALLRKEAEDAGVHVTEADVDAFFQRIGYTGKRYSHLVSVLRASPQAWTEGILRSTVRNWLAVAKGFFEGAVYCPPSRMEVLTTYRDLAEQIDLRVLKLPAEDFLKDLKEADEPNQARIEAHFNQYRTVVPGRVTRADSFGFGYRQPGRARLQYLLVRGDVIGRFVRPKENDIIDYYNASKAKFVKEVPVAGASSRPADPNAPPPKTRKVQKTFAEARDEIAEVLHAQVVQMRMDELISQVESAVARASRTDDPGQAYEKVRQATVLPADTVLKTPLPGLKIENRPLKEAVEALAEAAKLRAICYPWGTHGQNTLDPEVKVTIRGARSLGEALAEISRQAKWPELTWKTCEGFRGVLFSVGGPKEGEGIDFFPLQVVETGWRTFGEIAEDEVLGYAFASPAGGTTLARIVYSVKGLSPDPRQTPLIRVGTQGSRMYVMGDKPGRLLFRLLEVSPPHVPASLNDTPQLRDEVVKDLRLQAAFNKALETAKKLQRGAESIGLQRVADAQEKETTTTGLFARRGRDLGWTEVPALGLRRTAPVIQAFVIRKAFELSPKNVEPGAAKDEIAVAVIPVQARREVLLVERIDFRPIVRSEYEQQGRLATAWGIRRGTDDAMVLLWFRLDNVARRLELSR